MAPIGLPPGFRFHPTDEELVNYCLERKSEPWELAEKSFRPIRDPEWYFFGLRDRKHPNGFRTNRATRPGYRKSTRKDHRVTSQNRPIGMKKKLVRYRGREPWGMRTNWVMYEYRLHDKEWEDTSGIPDSYALCRVFEKNTTPSEVEEQVGRHGFASMDNLGRASVYEYETMSPVAMSSSPCVDMEDKKDSWMRFITDYGTWYPPNSIPLCGEADAAQIPIS